MVQSAELQYVMLHTFLDNGAEKAKAVIDDYTPDFDSYEAYLAFADSLNCGLDAVSYQGGKTQLEF